jgi:tungstate transport system permease protein
MIAAAVAASEGANPYGHSFSEGLSTALRMIGEGNPLIVDTTLRTLRLAFETTLIASLVGVPIGTLVGVGAFRGRGAVLGFLNGLTRVPPVVIGVLGVLLLYPESPWGGGPLSDLGWWYQGTVPAYFVQTLVALPIVTALTASAVQSVSPNLLEQARAFGASGPRRLLLAVREARLAVLAGILVALGVTITAVGALIVIGQASTTHVGSGYQPITLAVGALLGVRNGNGAEGTASAVAFATILFGLFIILAATLTRLQYGRRRSAS